MSFLPTLILRVLSLLPLRALHALGTVLGWITYGMSPTYRRHLRAHLAQAGYTDARVRRAAIAAAGRMIVETPAIWFRPQAEVAALVKEESGLDAALAARAQGKEIVFLTPHLGSFEITVQYTSLRVELQLLPDHETVILARYGVRPEDKEALFGYWRKRFEADPPLRMMFARGYAQYLAWFRENPAARENVVQSIRGLKR